MAANSQYRRQAKALKNPTPVELPSGRWRCQVTVNGHRVSIVEDDPKTAHAKAVALRAEIIKAQRQPETLTVGEAIDRYIASKDGVLSPSTIRGYKGIRKNNLKTIMDVKLGALTPEAVQLAVNEDAKELSPKSVRNAHGLLSAALAVYLKDFRLDTTLPQKVRHEIGIPTEDEVAKIMEAAHGTEMELPLLLAVWLGLRQSEIRGITWDAINGNILHVRQAMVDGIDGPAVKATKTYSGDRWVRLPAEIIDVINRTEKVNEHLVQLSGKAMYARFSKMCKRLGIQHYRFHDLRHLSASIMLAAGIPNKYAQARLGHATDHMLKTVYQHIMATTRSEVDDIVDQKFSAILHTNCTRENGDN